MGFLGFLNCGLCVNLVCLCIYSIWFLVLGLFVNFVVWCGDVVWCCWFVVLDGLVGGDLVALGFRGYWELWVFWLGYCFGVVELFVLWA